MNLYFLIYLHTIYIFSTEHGILLSAPFLREELLIQTSNLPEDSKNIQKYVIHFNDNKPRVDSCFPTQTIKQIELVRHDVLFSTLIDKCHDYSSDPYLFLDITFSPNTIRTLFEISPCQPGFNNNFYVF